MHDKPLCIVCDLIGTLIDPMNDPFLKWEKLEQYPIIETVTNMLVCMKCNISRIFIVDTGKVNMSKTITERLVKYGLDLHKITYIFNVKKFQSEVLYKETFLRKFVLPNHSVFLAIDNNEECCKMYSDNKILTFKLVNEFK